MYASGSQSRLSKHCIQPIHFHQGFEPKTLRCEHHAPLFELQEYTNRLRLITGYITRTQCREEQSCWIRRVTWAEDHRAVDPSKQALADHNMKKHSCPFTSTVTTESLTALHNICMSFMRSQNITARVLLADTTLVRLKNVIVLDNKIQVSVIGKTAQAHFISKWFG